MEFYLYSGFFTLLGFAIGIYWCAWIAIVKITHINDWNELLYWKNKLLELKNLVLPFKWYWKFKKLGKNVIV